MTNEQADRVIELFENAADTLFHRGVQYATPNEIADVCREIGAPITLEAAKASFDAMALAEYIDFSGTEQDALDSLADAREFAKHVLTHRCSCHHGEDGE